jgi:hypothetical protein
LTEELTQTKGKATMGRSDLGKPLGEDVPQTVRPITVELADVQLQEDLHILNRQVPDRTLKAAMDPMSGSATHWTKGARRHPFTGEDQTFGLSAGGKQAEAAQMRQEGM